MTLVSFEFFCFLDSDGCADGERRVVSSSDGNGGEEGRVEVCFNGMWGGVYSTSMWNASQVGVICRGLGYEPSGTCTCKQLMIVQSDYISHIF